MWDSVQEGEVAPKHQRPEHGERTLQRLWGEKERHEGAAQAQEIQARLAKCRLYRISRTKIVPCRGDDGGGGAGDRLGGR